MPSSTLVSTGQRRIGPLVGGGLRFGDGWVWGPYSGERCSLPVAAATDGREPQS